MVWVALSLRLSETDRGENLSVWNPKECTHHPNTLCWSLGLTPQKMKGKNGAGVLGQLGPGVSLFQNGQWRAVPCGQCLNGDVIMLPSLRLHWDTLSPFLIVFAFWSFAIHVSGIKLVTTPRDLLLGFQHWFEQRLLPSPGMRFSVLRDWGSWGAVLWLCGPWKFPSTQPIC